MLKLKNLITEAPEDTVAKIDQGLSGGLATAVKVFSTLAADEEFQKIVTAGKTDGDPADEVIEVKSPPTKAKDLYATQKEIGFDKSINDLLTNEWGCIEAAFSDPALMPSPGEKTPLLTAQVAGKKVVLDGHHRWSLAFMINPDCNLACTEMQMPAGATDEDALKIMQLAIAAKAGAIKTKTAPKPDLMTTPTKTVEKYILENIQPKGIEAFKKFGKGLNLDSAEKIAKHCIQAHATIQKRKGEFERTIMPQADHSGVSQSDVNTALGAGDINYNAPKPSDVKEEGISLKEHFQKIAKIKR